MKTCEQCSAAFEPVRNAQRFCRPSCHTHFHNTLKRCAQRQKAVQSPTAVAERLRLCRAVRAAAIRQEPAYGDDPFWDA